MTKPIKPIVAPKPVAPKPIVPTLASAVAAKPNGNPPAKAVPKVALRVPEPGRYAIRGQSDVMRRQGDARRAVEDRKVLRELGLLDP